MNFSALETAPTPLRRARHTRYASVHMTSLTVRHWCRMSTVYLGSDSSMMLTLPRHAQSDAIAELRRIAPVQLNTPRHVTCKAKEETSCQTLQHCMALQVQDFRDERELCEVCGRIEHRCKARGKLKSPLLECDKCLRAFHADCCEPPLKAIPQVRSPYLCQNLTCRVHVRRLPVRPQPKHVMHLPILQQRRMRGGRKVRGLSWLTELRCTLYELCFVQATVK